MFITFEGIDGSGKSTQLELLKEYLTERNYDVITIREPGGTVFSEAIRRILLSHKFKIEPVTELLLFDAARSNLINQVIKPALKENKIVLCDRFYDSTVAYQGYGGGVDLEKIFSVNNIATEGLKPDVTFFLDVSLKISNNRGKDRDSDRIESSGNSFFERVRKGFFEIAKNEPERMIIINSEESIADTHNRILNVLKTKFPNKIN